MVLPSTYRNDDESHARVDDGEWSVLHGNTLGDLDHPILERSWFYVRTWQSSRYGKTKEIEEKARKKKKWKRRLCEVRVDPGSYEKGKLIIYKYERGVRQEVGLSDLEDIGKRALQQEEALRFPIQPVNSKFGSNQKRPAMSQSQHLEEDSDGEDKINGVEYRFGHLVFTLKGTTENGEFYGEFCCNSTKERDSWLQWFQDYIVLCEMEKIEGLYMNTSIPTISDPPQEDIQKYVESFMAGIKTEKDAQDQRQGGCKQSLYRPPDEGIILLRGPGDTEFKKRKVKGSKDRAGLIVAPKVHLGGIYTSENLQLFLPDMTIRVEDELSTVFTVVHKSDSNLCYHLKPAGKEHHLENRTAWVNWLLFVKAMPAVEEAIRSKQWCPSEDKLTGNLVYISNDVEQRVAFLSFPGTGWVDTTDSRNKKCYKKMDSSPATVIQTDGGGELIMQVAYDLNELHQQVPTETYPTRKTKEALQVAADDIPFTRSESVGAASGGTSVTGSNRWSRAEAMRSLRDPREDELPPDGMKIAFDYPHFTCYLGYPAPWDDPPDIEEEATGIELRVDPADGVPKSLLEFLTAYDSLDKWESAPMTMDINFDPPDPSATLSPNSLTYRTIAQQPQSPRWRNREVDEEMLDEEGYPVGRTRTALPPPSRVDLSGPYEALDEMGCLPVINVQHPSPAPIPTTAPAVEHNFALQTLPVVDDSDDQLDPADSRSRVPPRDEVDHTEVIQSYLNADSSDDSDEIQPIEEATPSPPKVDEYTFFKKLHDDGSSPSSSTEETPRVEYALLPTSTADARRYQKADSRDTDDRVLPSFIGTPKSPSSPSSPSSSDRFYLLHQYQQQQGLLRQQQATSSPPPPHPALRDRDQGKGHSSIPRSPAVASVPSLSPSNSPTQFLMESSPRVPKPNESPEITKTRRAKKYKKRFCAIKIDKAGSWLEVSKSTNTSKGLEVVERIPFSKLSKVDSVPGDDRSFKIYSQSGESWVFLAPSRDERKHWMDWIWMSILNARKDGGGSPGKAHGGSHARSHSPKQKKKLPPESPPNLAARPFEMSNSALSLSDSRIPSPLHGRPSPMPTTNGAAKPMNIITGAAPPPAGVNHRPWDGAKPMTIISLAESGGTRREAEESPTRPFASLPDFPTGSYDSALERARALLGAWSQRSPVSESPSPLTVDEARAILQSKPLPAVLE